MPGNPFTILRPIRTAAGWVALGLLTGAVSGCFHSGKIDVNGTVTFKGQPVPAGVIFFDPDVTRGHDGPQGYASIKNGQFSTRATGRGVVAGPHRVRIHGFDGKPGQELPLGKMMFPEYTQAVDLADEATPVEIRVSPGGP